MSFLIAPIAGDTSELTGEQVYVVIAPGRPVRYATDCEVDLSGKLATARTALTRLISADDCHIARRIAAKALDDTA